MKVLAARFRPETRGASLPDPGVGTVLGVLCLWGLTVISVSMVTQVSSSLLRIPGGLDVGPSYSSMTSSYLILSAMTLFPKKITV